MYSRPIAVTTHIIQGISKPLHVCCHITLIS